MENTVRTIAMDKLEAHPDNPNQQSKVNFGKLVRNIERTGRYEPILVRPHPEKENRFQIINGHHRQKALYKLGYESADCIVWEVDDEQTDILLATVNRLCGTDKLDKKINLLKRLNKSIEAGKLAKLVPQTAKQIEQLTNLKLPRRPAEGRFFANPMVFFVNDGQREVIERALSAAEANGEKTKAFRRAEALARTAEYFLGHKESKSGA